MGQVGIPLFYLQELAGARIRFKDNFADGSQFWGWRLFRGEISEVGKSGTEANGVYQLAVNPTINGEWDTTQNEAPRLFVGALSYPCEIKTRLDFFSGNMGTHAGLFIGKSPVTFGADNFLAIVQRRTATETGVAVVNTNNALLAYVPDTTLPMWFRIRLGCGADRALNAYFDYSLDGANWTNLWAQNIGWTIFSLGPPAVGLYVSNFAAHNEVVGRFEFFEMRPRTIN